MNGGAVAEAPVAQAAAVCAKLEQFIRLASPPPGLRGWVLLLDGPGRVEPADLARSEMET